ncbi:hypothetical protein HYY69_08335 [Candidatus Woesearchaeota archaeon]|nr:hypothetical protein [Candidatus Woesearchaeota archaeon]
MTNIQPSPATTAPASQNSSPLFNKIKKIYVEKYKLLLIIPFLLLFFAFAQLGYQYTTTGSFVKKGVSISGGVTITILDQQEHDLSLLQQQLQTQYPSKDIDIKKITDKGKDAGLLIEANLFSNDDIELFLMSLESILGKTRDTFNVEITGPSLGKSFFRSLLKGLTIAFICMGIVVFIYFRTPVPSLAVILAAASDMIVTLAVVNLLGMKLSTAGIVAFLFLIGFSVDTDVLLTIRVLKHKEGTYIDRIFSSIRTGMTMTLTALATAIVALLFSNSEVISQIMTILLIGLIADIIFTWIQNVGLLRLYLERKEHE